MENQESRMDGTGISEKVIREICMAAEKYQIEKVIEYRLIL